MLLLWLPIISTDYDYTTIMQQNHHTNKEIDCVQLDNEFLIRIHFNLCYVATCVNTVWLIIFVDLIFRGLGSSDNFVGLYFRGLPTLIT